MKKLFLAAAALLATTAMPAMAQTVVNGSFENPAVGSPSYGGPGLTGLAGFEPNGGAFGYAAAPDGNQILHLQGEGTATLSLLDLILGTTYTVSFFTAARPNAPVLPVSLSYNDTVLGTFTPTTTTFTSLNNFSFTATGTTGSLTFAGLNPNPVTENDQNTGIDNVTIAAVPEPATWAMMLVGFGMVGFGLRARRNGKVTTHVAFA